MITMREEQLNDQVPMAEIKNLKAVAVASTDEKGRFNLDGVRLRKDGVYEASNGRYLLQGRVFNPEGLPDETWIPKEFIDRIKAKKKRDERLTLYGPVNGKLAIASEFEFCRPVPVYEMDTYKPSEEESKDGTLNFPPTEMFWPKEKAEFLCGLSIDILEDIVKAAKMAGCDEMVLEFRDVSKGRQTGVITAQLFEKSGHNEEALEALIMPIKVPEISRYDAPIQAQKEAAYKRLGITIPDDIYQEPGGSRVMEKAADGVYIDPYNSPFHYPVC